MNQIVVLNEEQFEDIIYRTVSRCLNEKNIGSNVEKPEDEGPDFGGFNISEGMSSRISNQIAER